MNRMVIGKIGKIFSIFVVIKCLIVVECGEK